MNLRDRLAELLEPVVNDLGLVLWELEYLPRANGALLRLYIDVPKDEDTSVSSATSGNGGNDEVMATEGITVDDCERVSHAVSEVLDAADPLPGHYTLEVSSPGLDRVLRTRAHFARFAGEPVRVEMAVAVSGRKRFSGRLLNVSEHEITMEVDGRTLSLALAEIHKARLAPEFS